MHSDSRNLHSKSEEGGVDTQWKSSSSHWLGDLYKVNELLLIETIPEFDYGTFTNIYFYGDRDGTIHPHENVLIW